MAHDLFSISLDIIIAEIVMIGIRQHPRNFRKKEKAFSN
jgi:hypothetical protein